ncbi:MAG: hypothetical protein K0R28_6024 [Paenibacillus sp.]|jgi:hypothetical protein|nr:hypothetical protein [Paenibacillus sp.]
MGGCRIYNIVDKNSPATRSRRCEALSIFFAGASCYV